MRINLPASPQVNPKMCEQSPWNHQQVSPPQHFLTRTILTVYHLLLFLHLLLLHLILAPQRGDEDQSEHLQREHIGGREGAAASRRPAFIDQLGGGNRQD